MFVTPGKHDLQERMQVGEGHLAPDKYPTPDERTNAPEDDAELVNAEWCISCCHTLRVAQRIVPLKGSPRYLTLSNITGVSHLQTDLNAKQLELLKEAVPGVSRVAVLADPATPYTPGMVQETERAARALGVQLHILEVPEPSGLEAAFAALTTARVDALMVLPSARFGAHRRQIVDLVAHRKLPAIYDGRGWVAAGGLMFYGRNAAELLRRTATYVDKILKGAKPADLPIEQPMTFELVINLQAAEALGLTIPPTLLFHATEIIREAER
jgi:putative tryptophan/tyrosine transport system substrate-binding protein